MLHHYPTKPVLIAAVIEFAFYRHMQGFIGAMRGLAEADRVQQNAGMLVDFQSCLSREYRAYIELNIAARTDEELRRVFLPLARQHARVWKEEIRRVFPEWGHDSERFELGIQVVRSALDGLLLNREIWDSPRAEANVLATIGAAMLVLRDGGLPAINPAAFEEISARETEDAARMPRREGATVRRKSARGPREPGE